MTEHQGRGTAVDVVTTALDEMQHVLEEHTVSLQHLEARPIVDLHGVERRLDELADVVERVQRPVARSRRPWWVTPLLVTLAFVLGVGSGWASLVWRLHQSPHVPAVMAAPTKKGR